MSNYYEILGCDRSATYDEIKRTYHEQVKKFHPDKTKQEDSTTREFLMVDKAWKTLRDADKKREYDLILSKNDLEETPLYCEVDLEDMIHDADVGEYTYVCRCGGVYVLQENHVHGCEKVKVWCDECTFHIVVINKRQGG